MTLQNIRTLESKVKEDIDNTSEWNTPETLNNYADLAMVEMLRWELLHEEL